MRACAHEGVCVWGVFVCVGWWSLVGWARSVCVVGYAAILCGLWVVCAWGGGTRMGSRITFVICDVYSCVCTVWVVGCVCVGWGDPHGEQDYVCDM